MLRIQSSTEKMKDCFFFRILLKEHLSDYLVELTFHPGTCEENPLIRGTDCRGYLPNVSWPGSRENAEFPSLILSNFQFENLSNQCCKITYNFVPIKMTSRLSSDGFVFFRLDVQLFRSQMALESKLLCKHQEFAKSVRNTLCISWYLLLNFLTLWLFTTG